MSNMSNLTGISSASSAWSPSSTSGSKRMDKLFGKVDTDGNGTVDKSELQGLFDKIAQKTGGTALSADALFSKIDTNGDGSISKDELAAGMKSLMPKPSSTVAFAQHAGGAPPSGASSGSSSSASTAPLDPLDTNGDGVVSPAERAAGDLKALMSSLYTQIASSMGQQTDSATLSIAA